MQGMIPLKWKQGNGAENRRRRLLPTAFSARKHNGL